MDQLQKTRLHWIKLYKIIKDAGICRLPTNIARVSQLPAL